MFHNSYYILAVGIVVENKVVPPDLMFNQNSTTQRGGQLCVVDAGPARTLLSKYTPPATASDCFLLVPVNCHCCDYCNRTEPSKSDAQVVITVNGKQTEYETRAGAFDLPASSPMLIEISNFNRLNHDRGKEISTFPSSTTVR